MRFFKTEDELFIEGEYHVEMRYEELWVNRILGALCGAALTFIVLCLVGIYL